MKRKVDEKVKRKVQKTTRNVPEKNVSPVQLPIKFFNGQFSQLCTRNFKHNLNVQEPKKNPQSPKIARTAPKKFLNNSRALPNKTRVLRQIAPESSPESSVKSLSQIIECFRGRHRGGAILLNFCGSPDPFFIQPNEPFSLKPCTPVKPTP